MSEYKVHDIYWKAASINIQVLEIPSKDIEDKLAILSENKGLVNRIQYEDFLLNNCVLNISNILKNIINSDVFDEDLISLRKDLIRIVLDVNPNLRPENLVINKNNIIKSSVISNAKGRPLMSNIAWNSKKAQDSYINNTIMSIMPPMVPIANLDFPIKNFQQNVPVKDRGVNHKGKETVWWERMSMHITIKIFDKADIVDLIGGKEYKNKLSYMAYLINTCVDDIEQIVALCDQTGLSKRVPEQVIIEELYGLIVKKNTFLEYEKIDFDKIKKHYEESIEEQEPAEIVGWMDPRMPNIPIPSGFIPVPPNFNRPTGPMFSKRGEKGELKKKKRSFEKIDRKKLLKLDKRIKERVIGQDEAVGLISDAVQRAAAGLRPENHPIGSFIFTGQTGIGKTFTAKILAEKLVGSQSDLLVVDCSEYSQDHEYSKLIGAPSGYVGYDEGGYLTNAIMKQPFRVVLFDEFEKASPKMHDLLLQIFDEGRLTDGKGRRVSFNDTIVILTANLGVKEIDKARKPLGFQQDRTFTEDKKRKALESALRKTFKPEFLNRIDNIVHFRNLDKANYIRIVDLLFKDLQKLLNKKDIKLKPAKSIKEFIYKKGVDPKYGARPLERTIKREITTPLARMIIKEEVQDGSVVSVKYEKGKVKFKIKEPKKKKGDNKK